MELVYFYSKEDEKAMKKVLDDELFDEIVPTVMECKFMGIDKDGFCMYIKARDDLAQKAKKLLSETPAKEMTGAEGEAVIKAFREQSEAAEAGMGTLFG
ncbi:MAG: hypothetical protein ACE14P_13945 [Methanotrichaceae archaeon]